MPRTLANARVSIDRFIFEAEECARQKLGFAAMSTIFPVILSVSEAVVGKHIGTLTRHDDKNLFENFVPRMVDKDWLISRSSTVFSNKDIATDLSQIRDGLAHQMSLPNHVGMINTKSEAKEFLKANPTTSRIISVEEFIKAVQATIDVMVKNYPDAALDPNPRGTSRSLATRVVLPSGASGSPASRK